MLSHLCEVRFIFLFIDLHLKSETWRLLFTIECECFCSFWHPLAGYCYGFWRAVFQWKPYCEAFKNVFLFILLFVYVGVCVDLPQHMYGGQKRAL